ncbi:hypothetical protein [Nocardia asiatica]|uniref:hypothetical protein n=1 Tax=Nocardia asiatica TaxID=209252 RepID=UPI0024553FBB|nr:hypothetical protein [Nocardia asiatica]
MSDRCGAELCHYWTGQGCACEFLGIEPAIACGRCDGTRNADGSCPVCERPFVFDPESFGTVRHGVRVDAHEDDWGWTILGHHEPRRIAAACIADARDCDVLGDLRDYCTAADLIDGIQRKWATNFRASAHYDVMWDWCDEHTPDAVPITVVNP